VKKDKPSGNNAPDARMNRIDQKNQERQAQEWFMQCIQPPALGARIKVMITDRWGTGLYETRARLCTVFQITDNGFFVQEVGREYGRHMIRRGELWRYK